MTEPDDPEVVVTIPDAPAGPPADDLRVVRVLQAPLGLWDRAAQHTAELMREFALLRIGRDTGTTRDVPDALLELVAQLRARYAGTSAQQEGELETALLAGELTRDFTYHVPPGVGEACATLLDLLDAADDYCADGHDLMTLVSPPDQRAFRRWYLGEFVQQLAGRPPQPWSAEPDQARPPG